MPAIKCPPPPQPNKLSNLPGSEVEKRIKQHYDELIKQAGVLSPYHVMELRLQKDYALKALAAAHLPVLKNYNRLESWLAKNLGWKSWLWQAPFEAMTDAGAVRYALLDRINLAKNLVETASIYKALPDIDKMYKQLKQALPNLPELQLQELLYDHIVIGQYPKLYNVIDSPVVRNQLIARYNKHVTKLQELGIDTESIKLLDRLSGRVSEAFDNLRYIAAKEGLDIQTLKNGGYFPIRAQEEAKRLMQAFSEEVDLNARAAFIDPNEFFLYARASNVPLVLKPRTLAIMLGMKENELLDIATTPGALSNLLNKRFTPDKIEKLFEGGILTQAPAMSDELTNFFRAKLDLPIRNLGEAIVLDPVEAIKNYADQLKDAVAKSTIVKDLLTEGIEKGWVVDSSFIRANTKDYVKLSNNSVLKKAFEEAGVAPDLQSLYIHRTAADQISSILQLNQSWADLGMVGQLVQTWVLPYTRLFRKLALLAAPINYIKRVMMQNIVALYAATGDLTQLGIATAEVTRAFAQKNLDVFNKNATVVIGNTTYSLRDLFEITMLKRGGDFITALGERLENVRHPLERLNVKSMQRFLLFNKAYHAKFGSPFTGKIQATADMLKEMTKAPFDAAYAVLAAINQHSDFAARWAAVRTLAFKRGKEFASIDDLIRHTDEFFQINIDTGSFGRVLGSVGMPFASFALVAPGSALRYTVMYPWRAARMLKLYTYAMNGNQLTDAEMAQWQKDDYVIAIAKDPNTGKAYGVMPTTIDFYLSSYAWFRELAEDIGRASGAPVGSVKEQVEQAKNPLKPFEDALKDLVSKTYISAFFPFLGIKPDTLEPLPDPEQEDTLLGIPMPKALREAAIRVFPILKSADERWLPAEVVGQARRASGDFKEIQPAQPGWLGRTPSTGGKRPITQPVEEFGWFFKNIAGLTLVSIDPQQNLIRSYEDFDKLQTNISSTLNKINRRLLTEAPTLSEEDKAALETQRKLLLRLRVVLKYNKFLVDKLAEERGLAKPSALKILRSRLTNAIKPTELDEIEAFIDYYLKNTP
jgi:hypothetical protein